MKIKQFLYRLVSILSMLERPPENGCAWKFFPVSPNEEGYTGRATHYLGLSASYLRQSLGFLWDAVRFFGFASKRLASSFCHFVNDWRCRFRFFYNNNGNHAISRIKNGLAGNAKLRH